jgi:hypothetical protein
MRNLLSFIGMFIIGMAVFIILALIFIGMIVVVLNIFGVMDGLNLLY